MSRSKGNEAEKKACEYLRSHDFTIIEQNFYAKKLGEIDIIATQNGTYHFIEVKSATDYETAINNITPQKLSKLTRSVEYYLQHKKLNVHFCIDAVIITDLTIEHLENITI